MIQQYQICLQFFSDTAYNPVSNQQRDTPLDRRRQQFQQQSKAIQGPPPSRRVSEYHPDTSSHRSLESEYGSLHPQRNTRQEQRSADNLLHRSPAENIYSIPHKQHSAEVYSTNTNEANSKTRAQPQVPLFKNMGRRASEGSMLSDKEVYGAVKSSNGTENMKSAKPPYLGETSHVMRTSVDMPGLSYPSYPGYGNSNVSYPGVNYPASGNCGAGINYSNSGGSYANSGGNYATSGGNFPTSGVNYSGGNYQNSGSYSSSAGNIGSNFSGATYNSANSSRNFNSANSGVNYNSANSSANYVSGNTSGNYKSGNTSGNYNSGNTGGNYNSGNYSSGNYHSGNYNSGNSNSGTYNSGNSNSGNSNSDNFSSNYNSGNYAGGNYTNYPTENQTSGQYQNRNFGGNSNGTHFINGANPANNYSNIYAQPVYPNLAGCRLSYDAGRRESSASLSSSIADGSKGSLNSFDSSTTLTGELDDSLISHRMRKSFQQKEEFLRRPSNPPEKPLIPKEFYSRPNKLEKPTWPPPESKQESSPSRAAKPTHQNFQRVKNDIDSERDYTSTDNQQIKNGEQSLDNKQLRQSDLDRNQMDKMEKAENGSNRQQSNKDQSNYANRDQSNKDLLNHSNKNQSNHSNNDHSNHLDRDQLNKVHSHKDQLQNQSNKGQPIKTHSSKNDHTQPARDRSVESNGSFEEFDDKVPYPPTMQMVSKRARQFESGRPLPEDDPQSYDRTSFYRSELARLSSKHAVPNVNCRAREFETMSEPRRDGSSSSANSASTLRRSHRDSRSLESSGWY